MRNKERLIVEIIALDDVQDAGILIKKILIKKGHNVHAYTEEEDAIAFAGKNKVDLGGCPRIAIFSQIEAFLKNKRSHICDIGVS